MLMHIQTQLCLGAPTSSEAKSTMQQQQQQQQQQVPLSHLTPQPSTQPSPQQQGDGPAPMDCDAGREGDRTAAITAAGGASGSMPEPPAGLPPKAPAAPPPNRTSSMELGGNVYSPVPPVPVPGHYAALLWGVLTKEGQQQQQQQPPPPQQKQQQLQPEGENTQKGVATRPLDHCVVPLTLAIVRVHGAAAAQVLLVLPLQPVTAQPPRTAPQQQQEQQQQLPQSHTGVLSPQDGVLQLLGVLEHTLRNAGVAKLLVHALPAMVDGGKRVSGTGSRAVADQEKYQVGALAV